MYHSIADALRALDDPRPGRGGRGTFVCNASPTGGAPSAGGAAEAAGGEEKTASKQAARLPGVAGSEGLLPEERRAGLPPGAGKGEGERAGREREKGAKNREWRSKLDTLGLHATEWRWRKARHAGDDAEWMNCGLKLSCDLQPVFVRVEWNFMQCRECDQFSASLV